MTLSLSQRAIPETLWQATSSALAANLMDALERYRDEPGLLST